MPRLQWTFKSNHSSVELLPLSLSYNVSRSYGSILSYIHLLKRINGDTQGTTLNIVLILKTVKFEIKICA